eukprot:scaffold8992_cov154-Skeletonema_dohrnii-CCMP3373.AAC.5
MSTLPKIVMDPQRYDKPTTGRVFMGLMNEPGYYLSARGAPSACAGATEWPSLYTPRMGALWEQPGHR